MKKSTYLVAGLMLSSAMSFAQGADTAKAAAPASPFTFSGYIDSYFQKNLSNPLSGSNLGTSGFERVFDQKEGQFQLGLVQTKFGYSNGKSDVVVDLTFGQNADLGQYGNFVSQNTVGLLPSVKYGPITSTALAIKQAYFNYKATDKLTFTAGQFGTHIGYEVIDAPVNYNYSLSNLFGNGPFYHVGVKAAYAVSDKVGVMAGVVNGWDAIYDNNESKNIIAQVSFAPAKGYSFYLNYIGGNDDAPVTAGNPGINAKDTVGAIKQMLDLTAGFQITDKFFVGLNAAFGGKSNISAPTIADPEMVETRTWGGIALYSNYAFTERYGLGIRAEKFDNTQGVQYIGATDVTSLTATFNITLAEGHLLLKPEFRMDTYKKLDYNGVPADDIQQFEDSKGYNTLNSQSTIGLSAIYKF